MNLKLETFLDFWGRQENVGWLRSGFMPIGMHIQVWRKQRRFTLSTLAERAKLTIDDLDAIENGKLDPTVTMIEALAEGLIIPPAWLHYEPSFLKLLLSDPDDENDDWLQNPPPDPVMHRILAATRHDRMLYVLLTSLLEQGEPKLLRAAEVNLRSLLKQAQRVTVPWQSRPPGHFEPPSD